MRPRIGGRTALGLWVALLATSLTATAVAAPPRRLPPRKRRAPILDFEPRRPRDFALLSGLVEAPAAVNADGEVVSLTDDGVLSLTRANGYARWTVLVGPSRGAPALDEQGVAYVAGRDQQLYAVDAKGRILWVRDLPARPRGGVVVTPAALIVVLENGIVGWYTREQGKLISRIATGISPSTAPVLLHGQWLILASIDGELLKVDIRGTRWRRSLGRKVWIGALAPDGHGAVIATVSDGSLAKVGAGGEIAWQVASAVSPERSPVFAADGTLLVAAGDHLSAHDPATGARRWSAPTGGRIVGGPLVTDDGTVYVSVVPSHAQRRTKGSPPIAIVAVGADGELGLRTALPTAPLPGLTIAEHRLWVGLSDGTLRAFAVPQRGLARSSWAKARGGVSNSGESGGSLDLGKLEPE